MQIHLEKLDRSQKSQKSEKRRTYLLPKNEHWFSCQLGRTSDWMHYTVQSESSQNIVQGCRKFFWHISQHLTFWRQLVFGTLWDWDYVLFQKILLYGHSKKDHSGLVWYSNLVLAQTSHLIKYFLWRWPCHGISHSFYRLDNTRNCLEPCLALPCLP